jgi:hypothetical protein
MLKVFFNDRATRGVFRGSLELHESDARLCWQGVYPDGSQGHDIADAIRRFTMQSMAILAKQTPPPNTIRLDLRGLDYQWGNNLLDAFAPLAHSPADKVVLYAPEQHCALQVFMHELDFAFVVSPQ